MNREEPGAETVRLYRMFSGALVAYATAWTRGDLHLAEELVDDAFVEMYRRWDRVGSFNDRGRYGWLRAVVRNLAVSTYRKRNGIVSLVDPLGDDYLNQPGTTDDPDDPVHAVVSREHEALAHDLLERCLGVIREMPEHLSFAILLRGAGHTSRQVGALMGVQPSTVRGYWKLAIEELNSALGDVIRVLDVGEVIELAGEEGS